ncbi:MAG: hypothetical protein J2P31_18255, partial [Blastocatellia bacterium]|nr:hypothetical protein [Blastocatellia bacterium]
MMTLNKPILAFSLFALAAAGFPRQADGQSDLQLPSTPLKFGAFAARFDPGGTFKLEGAGWPVLSGNWKRTGDELELLTSQAPKDCQGPGRYRVRLAGKHLVFQLIADDCVPRRMILNGSDWSPAAEARVIPTRRIVITANSSGARPPKTAEPSAA